MCQSGILLLIRHVHTVSIVSNIKLLGADRHNSRRLTPCEPGFIVSMQIRLGILNEDLADRFCVSSGGWSKMFTTWIKMLARLLGGALIVWLSRDIIQSNVILLRFYSNRQ